MKHTRTLPTLAAALMRSFMPPPSMPISLDPKMIPLSDRKPLPADATPAPSVGPVSRQVRRQGERQEAKRQRSRDKLVQRMAAKAWRSKQRSARKATA